MSGGSLPSVSGAWVRGLLALPFGLCAGSFLTVVVDRVPKRESVVSPRSRCPECGAEIRNRDNVPILSYLFLRGRCRSCGTRIPIRYPLLELGTAGLFVGVAVVYPSVYVIAMLSLFVAVMLALAVIDIGHKIIPNRITYPSVLVFAAAIVVGWAIGEEFKPLEALVGFLAYGGFFLVVAFISPRGMGMGDVKLAGLIGLVVGSIAIGNVAVAAGVAIVLGGLGALLALLLGKGRKSQIPFGPYLAAGAVAAVLWGDPIARWYVHRFT